LPEYAAPQSNRAQNRTQAIAEERRHNQPYADERNQPHRSESVRS
jgi:hypothetical protein